MSINFSLKYFYTFFLTYFLICNIAKSQFISLQGNQFKDQTGIDFYPIICNYSTELAKEANGNIFILPTSKYGLYNNDECSNLLECQQKLQEDFNEIKALGFNTVRITTAPAKKDFLYGTNRFALKNQFAFEYENFPNPYISSYGVILVNLNQPSTYFLAVLNQINLAITMASNAGLFVIIGTGGGKYLLNNSLPPVSANYSGPIVDQHVQEYKDLLVFYANYFKNNTNILAYDIWNEPAWHDDEVLHSKLNVCEITSLWYNAIRNVDQYHLITMGLSNFHDVWEWDPSIIKVDFLSQHIYPDAPEFEFNPYNQTHDQNKIKNRYHAELLWLKRNATKPWLIGETGFSASNASNQNYINLLQGSEAEQADFAIFCLNDIRNAGSSGMAWWQFQDVHYWAPSDGVNYKENWWGLIRRGNSVNGDYSNIRKPSASYFQNFMPGAVGAFDQTLDSRYFDPYDFATLNPNGIGSIGGTVIIVANNNIQPVQDAVVKGFSWIETIYGSTNDPDLIEEKGQTIYTFTDQSGNYTLRPYNFRTPSINSSHRILSLQCSAIGCNRIGRYSTGNTALSGSTIGTFLLTQADLSHANTTVEIEGVEIDSDINGSNYLFLKDDFILSNSTSNIQANREININSEFHVEQGSEVHFFIANSLGECIDFADIRNSNPDVVVQNNIAKVDVKEIEIQFKKTGRQILIAELQPNPSNGIVYLNIIEKSSNLPIEVNVFNTLGQCIKTYHTEENMLLLDGMIWNKGVYIVSIQNENTSIIKKVIIN